MPDASPNDPAPSDQANRALIRDLHAAADRARDERLRLAQAIKQVPRAASATTTTDGRSGDQSYPADTAQAEPLAQTIAQLDALVRDRMRALEASQATLDERSAQLDALKLKIASATDVFAAQVEQADKLKRQLDAAQDAAAGSADKLADEVRRKVADCERPIADRLAELDAVDKSIDKRIARMQQMHKQAGDAVDKHLLAALRDAKQQAAELAAPVKQELDRHLREQTEALEQAIAAKIAELDVDVEDALKPLTERFDAIVSGAQRRADELAAGLPGRIDALVDDRLEPIRDEVARQAAAALDGQDELLFAKAQQQYRQRIGKRLATLAGDYDEQADAVVAALEQRLIDATAHARHRAGEQVEAHLAELEAKAAHRVDAVAKLAESSGRSVTAALTQLTVSAKQAADEAEQDLTARLAALRQRVRDTAEQTKPSGSHKPEQQPAAVVDPDRLNAPIAELAQRLQRPQPKTQTQTQQPASDAA